MTPKVKRIFRNIIYFVLFAIIIGAFIYLSDKYAYLRQEKVLKFSDFYEEIKNDDIYDVIKATELIADLQKGKHLIFIGNSNSKWSKRYAVELTKVFELKNLDNIKYYDLSNDKTQVNSNYYEIIDLLNGNLVTTDDTEDNLLAPSFYIVENGKIKYYNTDTVAMRNDAKVDNYWTQIKQEEFLNEINTAINKYYLNS